MSRRHRALLPLLVLLAGCAGDSTTGPFGDDPSGVFMRAVIDGAPWRAGTWQHAPVTSLYHRESEQQFFSVSGVGVIGEDRWQIGLYIPASVGTHSLAPTGSSGFIVYDVLGGAEGGYGELRFDTDSLDPGTVVLTRWDPEHRIIEGTFNLTGLVYGADERLTVTVTEGRFRAHYDDR